MRTIDAISPGRLAVDRTPSATVTQRVDSRCADETCLVRQSAVGPRTVSVTSRTASGSRVIARMPSLPGGSQSRHPAFWPPDRRCSRSRRADRLRTLRRTEEPAIDRPVLRRKATRRSAARVQLGTVDGPTRGAGEAGSGAGSVVAASCSSISF